MLSYKQFGKILLLTGDLDPVYVMLTNSGLHKDVLARWCLAYWMFYHCGVASKIAAQPSKEFFNKALELFDSGCPRGTERRHFRGAKARKAIRELRKLSDNHPEWIVGFVFGEINNQKARVTRTDRRMSFTDVSRRVLELPQFGPWMAFKVADMGERVLGYDVCFDDCELSMYKDPIKGAALVTFGDQEHEMEARHVKKCVTKLIGEFGQLEAPPLVKGKWGRGVNLQEIETILCKYKSHVNGHYPPGKDSIEIHEALDDWGKLARKLQRHVPDWAKEQRALPSKLREAIRSK
jgi:hypothetical protein